ncbi:MAG: hypothetical protein AAF494_08515 [Pseudomonadota bacterium]
MYSEDDINSAVAAGALSAEAATSFRAHMSRVRELPRTSEENFKLINSFNDIFVAIGIVILLVAVGAIGQTLAGLLAPAETIFEFMNRVPNATQDQIDTWSKTDQLKDSIAAALAGLFVALTAWPLAEFFTRRRRMAFPSILLLLGFVGGVFAAVFGSGAALGANGNDTAGAAMVLIAGVIAAGGAFLHWRRFQVPITIAAATGVSVISLLLALLALIRVEPDALAFLVPVLIAGLAIFAFAMRWDISDRERITRRSDVAFWLHLLAAPMIAHPVFALLGVTKGDDLGIGAAVGVLGVYVGFGLVALAIDRRALLVSALVYVLFALAFLFREFGAVELTFALTALVIGSALLSLSAFWQPIRRSVVGALPGDLQAKLPPTSDMLPPQASVSPA